PRLRPAARLALARRVAEPRQSQRAGALARLHRLLLHRHHAVAADLHRRGGARRVRSEKDIPMSGEPLLSVRDLSVAFGTGKREVLAVDRVSFDIGKGETVALVGESGSGKSVTALSVMKLLPYPAAQHASGEITFKGQSLLTMAERDIRRVRGNDITI